ncbi:hypothetical protein [Piscirickettsia litoralis]|nr:hypothetical protein [Piscirickettsia litoralis]
MLIDAIYAATFLIVCLMIGYYFDKKLGLSDLMVQIYSDQVNDKRQD